MLQKIDKKDNSHEDKQDEDEATPNPQKNKECEQYLDEHFI